MKRTLAVLLALCFLMSVTVAVVGAQEQTSTVWGNHTEPHPVPVPAPHPHPAPPAPIHIHPAPHPVPMPVPHPHPAPAPIHIHPAPHPVPAPHPHPAPMPVFKPGHHEGTWVPGHFEWKLVDKMVKIHNHWVVVKEWKHGHLVVVKVLKHVWVPGQWINVHGHR